MRIGILTFHSQLNYGGVLQCRALREVLAGLGHEVVVVDRWLDPDNAHLTGGYENLGPVGWLKFVVRGLLGCGQFARYRRCRRTAAFVRALGLTPYHFYAWSEAPKDLGIDCLVVGSDQVWHAGDWAWPTPDPYLLNGAPPIRAIAYAASFGLRRLPTEYDYAGGFGHFSAISVREAEAVSLVEGAGYRNKVQHVVDPTLLLARDEWHRLVPPKTRSRTLVCYVIGENIQSRLWDLERWARTRQWNVHVILDKSIKERPRTLRQLRENLFGTHGLKHVRVHADFGPWEFVQAFAEAEACLTDSFHALMFSCIYRLNVRFLRPSRQERRAMLGRIEEFYGSAMDGDFMCEDLDGALASLTDGSRSVFKEAVLEARREESLTWLQEVLR